MSSFREDLQTVINRHSQENGSNTPDFVLANYLCHCLVAFDVAVNARENWYKGSDRASSSGGWRGVRDALEMDWKPPTEEQLAASNNKIPDLEF